MTFVKIAKTGGAILDPLGVPVDADKDLAFTSDQNYMSIISERTDTSNGSNDLTIAHGLGYIPCFNVFFDDGTGTWYKPTYSGAAGNYADTSNIYIKTDTPNQDVRTVIWGDSQDNGINTGNNNASGKFKVAKNGYNATDTDITHFKFCSNGGVFKIKETVALEVTVNQDAFGDSDDTETYAHGLSYVPQVHVFSNGQQLPQFQYIAAGVTINLEYSIDSTNLNVRVLTSGFAVGDGDKFQFQAHILLDKIA